MGKVLRPLLPRHVTVTKSPSDCIPLNTANTVFLLTVDTFDPLPVISNCPPVPSPFTSLSAAMISRRHQLHRPHKIIDIQTDV